MSSVHKQYQRPFWFCAYSVWDEVKGRWVRRFKSTKTTNKRQAEEICRTLENAAKEAKTVTLTQDRAREILKHGLNDILMHSTGERLKMYTVREWGAQWLAGKLVENTARTHERYSAILKRFYQFLGPKADKDIVTVTAAEITTFRDQLARELSTNTANLAVKTLRVCFGAAYANDLLTSNTAAKVTKIKQSRLGRRREFKPAEIRLLLKEAGESEWRGLILTGLYTGQRLGDVAGLRWNQLNLENREIVFHVGKLGGQTLALPMAPALADYFESIPSSDSLTAPVFPRAAGVERTGTLSNQFHKLMEQAGLVAVRKNVDTGQGHKNRRVVGPLSFHSLRHSTVTFLKAAGVSDAVAQAIAGHASAAVSQIYTHLDTPTLRSAIEKLPDLTQSEEKPADGG
jgi:integrase